MKKNARDKRRAKEKTDQIVAESLFPLSYFRSSSLLPSQIAAACAVPIKYERLPFVFGRVVYLAEAFLQPASITVNLTAIEKLTASAIKVPQEYRKWFTAAAVQEVLIAHELYHILSQQPSGKSVENQAHQFVQDLTGLPFEPKVYEEILRQTTEWTTNNTIWELMEGKATQPL